MVAKSAPPGHGEGAWGVGLGGGWGLGGLSLSGSNSLGDPGGEVEEEVLPIWSRSDPRVRSDRRLTVQGEEEVMPQPAQDTEIQVSFQLPTSTNAQSFYRSIADCADVRKLCVEQCVGGK